MNKKRYIALTLMLSLLSINKVYAACTQEEIDAFKEVEDEYKVTYELNKDTKDYTVVFHQVQPDKYIYVTEKSFKSTEYPHIDETTVTNTGIQPGEYTIRVKSLNENCTDVLKKITIKLPKYNDYSEDPLCEGIEEFYLCQTTYDKEIDRETFESRVNTYKRTKAKENNKETEEEPNEMITYIQNNLIQIVIIIVFVVLVIITTIITIISARKSRRLE